ncbi:MAG TPA: carbohydrate-binding protein, partial [Ramlibacter sp.]|nr:carbohydrate-binding protein [Ramlibacter sp.]
MRVVAPIAIVTGTTLVSTNVGTGADPDAYNPATTYAQADRAVLAEVIYESVQDANLGNDPATTTPTWWKVVGPINSMAMFDRRIGTVTVNADVIEVELEPGCVITVLSVR